MLYLRIQILNQMKIIHSFQPTVHSTCCRAQRKFSLFILEPFYFFLSIEKKIYIKEIYLDFKWKFRAEQHNLLVINLYNISYIIEIIKTFSR